jgi:undecaprenyl-diphosphatase
MTLFHLVLFAIVQGITEFLPISSSGHLILLHQWTGATEDALALDVAVHLGSILAVILYFRSEVARAARGTCELLRGRLGSPDSFLALCLAIATIPAVILGGILAVTGWVDAPPQRGGDRLDDDRLRHRALVDRPHRPGSPRAGRLDAEARHAHRPLAGGGADPRRLPLGHHDHGGPRDSATPAATPPASRCSCRSRSRSPPAASSRSTRQGARRRRTARPAAIGAVLAFPPPTPRSLMMRFLNAVSFTPYVIYRVILGVVLLWIAYA